MTPPYPSRTGRRRPRCGFEYADHDAQYTLENATVEEFEKVLLALRDGLAGLATQPGEGDGEADTQIKTNSVAAAFMTAVRLWPDANPWTSGGSSFIGRTATLTTTLQVSPDSPSSSHGSEQGAGRLRRYSSGTTAPSSGSTGSRSRLRTAIEREPCWTSSRWTADSSRTRSTSICWAPTTSASASYMSKRVSPNAARTTYR